MGCRVLPVYQKRRRAHKKYGLTCLYKILRYKTSAGCLITVQNLFSFFLFICFTLLAHLSRRLKGELIVYPCSGVRRRRRRCQLFSNMNISEASRPIAIKFYLKHHWGWGKAIWGFGADQFRTLVSMATVSSHRVIMGETASSHFLDCF